MDIVEQAKEFAVKAHSRINHRRKYTKQPYSVHLNAVAKLVASVTDDPETTAAAWLHDTVEDTSVTLSDIETAFGKNVSVLVDALTDISKPGDGNRETRKKIDLQHLSKSSPAAQTVKLADLIDNGLDISKNDPRFAVVYLKEMAALLEILTDGDTTLYQQAKKVLQRCSEKINKVSKGKTEQKETVGFLYDRLSSRSRLIKLVMETFIARDLAEPIRSFDSNNSCNHVSEIMEECGLNLVCLRERGKICGYVLRKDLQQDGICSDYLRTFHHGQIVHNESPLTEVINVLGMHQYAFLRTLEDVNGYISRNEANKPEFRMWLFGIITFIEMEITHVIKQRYTGESWHSFIHKNRLQKAQELQAERLRRGERCELIDCLQYADKGSILLKNDELAARMNLDSKTMAKKVLKELESLRNNLAHSQDIGNQNWDLIARMSYNLECDDNLQDRK